VVLGWPLVGRADELALVEQAHDRLASSGVVLASRAGPVNTIPSGEVVAVYEASTTQPTLCA
jgi:hypothetical protein